MMMMIMGAFLFMVPEGLQKSLKELKMKGKIEIL